MYLISLTFFCLCYYAIAAVLPEDKDARIISSDYNNFERGLYEFSYVTSNGITRSETGRLVNIGQDNEHIVVNGTFSYTDPNGILRNYQYTADENGYHIQFQDSLDSRLGQGPVASAPVAPYIASLLGG